MARSLPLRNPPTYPRIPPRPTLDPAFDRAAAPARRLRRPRSPQLLRPQLHRHAHPDRETNTIDLVAGYVRGDLTGLDLTGLSPWTRWRIGRQLDELDASIPEYKWGHHWRADDVRKSLDL